MMKWLTKGRCRMGMVPVSLFILALSLLSNRAEARAAFHGSRVNAYAGPRGAAISGPNRTAVATRRGGAISGPNGYAVARRPVGALPRGYVHALPVGYRPVLYHGVSCYYANGTYYRPEFYGGSTVYVVVQ